MQSRTFARSASLLLTVTLALLSCGGDEGTGDDPPRERDPVARRDELEAGVRALATELATTAGQPWYKDTAIARQAGVVQSRLRLLFTQLSGIKPAADAPEARPADEIRKILAAVESDLDRMTDHYRTFRERANAEEPEVVDVMSHVIRVNEHLAYFAEKGIPCQDEQVRMRAIQEQWEVGHRYWTTEVAKLLIGQTPDPQLDEVGMTALRRVLEETKPIYDRTTAAFLRARHLDSQLDAVEQRLAWAEKVRAAVPADDPWLKRPEHDLEAATKRWEELSGRARELLPESMDGSREHRARSEATSSAMTTFMQELNRAWVPKGRELGIALPGVRR